MFLSKYALDIETIPFLSLQRNSIVCKTLTPWGLRISPLDMTVDIGYNHTTTSSLCKAKNENISVILRLTHCSKRFSCR
jgi:hypothetical protein